MILLIDALDSFTYNQGSRLRDPAKRGSGSAGLDVLRDRGVVRWEELIRR